MPCPERSKETAAKPDERPLLAKAPIDSADALDEKVKRLLAQGFHLVKDNATWQNDVAWKQNDFPWK
jgi:hypothetical protein